MQTVFVSLALLVLGIFILVVGLSKCQPYPKCSRCKAPFGPPPGGFESYDEKGKYCRACTRELGLRPWYAQNWMWEKMQREGWGKKSD